MKALVVLGLKEDDIVNIIMDDFWTTGINVIIQSIEPSFDDIIQKRIFDEKIIGFEYFVPYKNENQKQILINKYFNHKLKAKVVSKNNNLELEILNIV
jgi:uncharacterized membrane protein